MAKRRGSWQRFELLLARASGHAARLPAADALPFSQSLRALCYDLAVVRSRGFGRDLERHLNDLVVRGHNVLYASPPGQGSTLRELATGGFPRLLRAHAAYFAVALALFVLPAIASGVIIHHDSSVATRVLTGPALDEMDKMYSDPKPGESGLPSAPVGMTGFYIWNNVGIAFRCFATGVFFGIGTVYYLIYNGIVLGTVAGFLVDHGHSDRFFSFVIGHGAFELTAIVIAGAAGLRIGHAIVSPAPYTRGESLRTRGRDGARLATGAAGMLLVAALVEAGWSPLPLPSPIKYAAGATFWLLVVAYLGFAGRATAEPR